MRANTHQGRPIRNATASRRLLGVIILFVCVIGRPTVYAQEPAPAVRPVAAIDPLPVEPADPVRLLVGRSTIVDVGRPIARVSLTSADVADAHVTAPSEVLVNAKSPGTISMFVWDRSGAIRRYEVTVQRDLTRLSQQLKELFPGEPIDVRANGKSAVLSGAVTNKDIIEKAGNLAASFLDSKEELINLLQIRDGAPSNQVLLRVRFAEVSRSAMTELGLGLFTSPTGIENMIGRVTTQQFPAPGFDDLQWSKASSDWGSEVTSASGKFTFSDFLNIFLLNQKYDLGVAIRALQTKGLFQSLAEPNLIAESGKEASFLAGGEFPIPIAQASTAGTSITVQFKEFGIRLNFTPTVNGDRVHLKVRPEVSTLDFNNAVVLNGFRIPALTTRRTETEVELQNGQTFAIAGLINNNMISSVQKVPGIGHIPILGLLFTSKAAQKQMTELVVMITPEILPNNSPGVTTDLPRQQEPYLPPLTERQSVPPPPPAFPRAGTTKAGIAIAAPQQVQSNDGRLTPEAAAAALKANSAATRNLSAADESANAPSADPADAPAADSANAPAPAPVTEVPRPMTKEEREAAERARKAEERARVEAARQLARQVEADRRRAREEAERLERAAKEQAKRDAEQAKKQAEIDREKAKATAEAAKRYQAAQAAYEAELKRIENQQQ